MRFSKFIFLLLGIGLLGCQVAEKDTPEFSNDFEVEGIEISIDSLTLKSNEGLYYHKGSPFTGIAISHYDSGNRASETTYLKGKKHGFYRKWFRDGLLSFESKYVAGRQAGAAFTWWKNGNMRSASKYENGILQGVQEQWYINGAKFKKRNLVHGKEEGLQQSWRKNGKIYNNYEAKNGRIFGLKRANLCYELEDENIQYKEK